MMLFSDMKIIWKMRRFSPSSSACDIIFATNSVKPICPRSHQNQDLSGVEEPTRFRTLSRLEDGSARRLPRLVFGSSKDGDSEPSPHNRGIFEMKMRLLTPAMAAILGSGQALAESNPYPGFHGYMRTDIGATDGGGD